MSSKSVTALLEKSKKLKNVLKKRHGSSGKKVKNWKMSSKSVTALLGKKLKTEKCPQGKSKKLKIAKKRYGHIGT